MKHKITSYGYVLSEKRKKLKKEYIDLKGPELKKLRDNGTEIQEIITILTIAFTGDTIIDSVLENEAFLNSKILIMECTHFDDTVENAVSNGHIHFEQFVKNLDKFKNKWIILCHLSHKYRKLEDISEYLKILPENEAKRIIIWI